MQPGQFSIRSLLIVVAISAIVLGAYLGLTRAIQRADGQAVIQAIRLGRLELEPQREFIGEEAYQQLRAELEKQKAQN